MARTEDEPEYYEVPGWVPAAVVVVNSSMYRNLAESRILNARCQN